MVRADGQSIVGAFQEVALGDKRLERRLSKLAAAMESAPEASFVEQTGSTARLEAAYRFLGTTPVIWRLITTEPIETDSQISRVIDIYKKRWLIEEFFKVLKTGCQFESHQIENIKGLLVALSIESAIAWQLLRLRDVGRRNPDALGRELLSPCQYITIHQLRAKRGVPIKELSVLEVTQELAMLGSHLKNNGLPGWIVLKRGIKKLNLITEGLLLAAQMKDTRIDVINL